jgi:hypothetical protein
MGPSDAAAPQIRIIEHADVKRMPLAKAYREGALELHRARLVDEHHTAGAEAADDARMLEVLTPIAKAGPASGAWSTRWRFRSTAATHTHVTSRWSSTGSDNRT